MQGKALLTAYYLLNAHCANIQGKALLTAYYILNARCAIILECKVRLFLRRVIRVGVIQQVLYPQEQLLDCDAGFPTLVLVKDAETHRAISTAESASG